MKENNLNNDEAFEQCKKAAEQGDASAQNALGDIFRYGSDVVQKDAAEAIKWYKKAAEQLYDYALNNLGDCYYYGEGVEQDYVQAAKWYKQAAERGNEYAPDNLELLIQKLDNAAAQGDAAAQCNLAKCYDGGWGVEQDDEEAEKWFYIAAKQGDAEAQYHLGLKLRNKKEKTDEAVKWFRKAADQGHNYAKSQLANCYFFGTGVKKDKTKAIRLYTESGWKGLIAKLVYSQLKEDKEGNKNAQRFLGNDCLEKQ